MLIQEYNPWTQKKNASFPNMISKSNLRVDELPPLITGQEIVDQDGHPPPVLAQPDLGKK